jgi:hypothetical protein
VESTEELASTLNTAAQRQGVSGRFTVKEYPLMLPDPRLRRFAISHNDVHLGDVFNGALFDPTPVIRVGDVLIGNPYILARYLLVETWTLHLIAVRNGAKLSGRIDRLLSALKTLREKHWTRLYELEYIGRNVAESVGKRELAKAGSDKMFPPYYAKAAQ